MTDVVVGGERVVTRGRHRSLDVPDELDAAIGARLRRDGRLVTYAIDHIGVLVTNDPTRRRRPARVAARRGARDRRGPRRGDRAGRRAGRRRVDAGGRCVIPGFVDSHTHLVFAGDRSDEFVARMAGSALPGGWDQHHRGGHASRHRRRAARARSAAAAPRRSATASRASRSSRATASPSTTRRACSGRERRHRPRRRSSARTSSHPSTRAAPTTTSSWCAPTMLDALPPHGRWVDAFCETRRVRRRPVPGDPDGGRGSAASGRACTRTSSATARACSWRSSSAARRPTTAPTSPTPTSRRSPAATPSPRSCRRPTSRPASRIPMRARVIDAGATVALATNCNPGSSYTSSMAFCIALAVRDMHMTIEEAVLAATVGGAAALRRPDLGRLTVGLPRRRRASSTPRATPISSTAPACRWSPSTWCRRHMGQTEAPSRPGRATGVGRDRLPPRSVLTRCSPYTTG